MNKALLSSVEMDWCTPDDFFQELHKEFDFSLDAAATDKTAKCPIYYTPETDGLAQDWQGHTVFCNPPYGRQIAAWVKKGYEEAQKPRTTVVMLIPARTDTRYFHDHIYRQAEIRFLRGRLKFTRPGGDERWSAPFPSMVVVWRSPEQEEST